MQTHNSTLAFVRPERTVFRALILSLAVLAGLAPGKGFAQAGCPGGSGNPISITNFKPKETLGYDLALIKGTLPPSASSVTVTVNGAAAIWPVGEASFKAFARLKPGVNQVVVSSAGAQNACLELTYAPNAYSKQIQLVLVLAKDYVQGEPVFKAQPGEPNDLASAKKRIGLAALMQQSLYGELTNKAGMERRVPYFKRDAQDAPEVLVVNGDFNKADTGMDLGLKLKGILKKLESYGDGRTRYMIFCANTRGDGKVVSLSAGSLIGTEQCLFAWPQDPSEIIARFNDRRSPSDVNFPGLEMYIGPLLETYVKTWSSFWFKCTGWAMLNVAIPVDSIAMTPFGLKSKKLYSVFLSRESTGELITSELSLDTSAIRSINASEWFTGPIAQTTMAALPDGTVPKNLNQGLRYDYFEGLFGLETNFSVFAPVTSGTAKDFSLSARKVDRNYAFVWKGYLKVDQTGPTLIQLAGNGDGRLVIDGRTILTKTKNEQKQANGYPMEAGYHRFQLSYIGDSGQASLNLNWSAAGIEPQAIPSAALLSENPTTSAFLFEDSRFITRRFPGFFLMDLAKPERLTLRLVSPNGASLKTLFAGVLPAGNHRFPIPAKADNALVLVERKER